MKNENFHNTLTSAPEHFTASTSHEGTDTEKVEVTCLVAAKCYFLGGAYKYI